MGLTSQISALGTNISSGNITNSLAGITTIAQQYIVSPIAAFGLAGFVFNAEGESIAELSADITDHYTETNVAIQDHIAIHPKRITLKGYVGELIYNTAGGTPSALNTLAQKLTEVAAYLPALTAGAQQAQSLYTTATNGTLTAASAITSTSDIYGLVKNILGAFGNTKNQQNAYTYFKSLMQSATLMGIQTPWEFMTNMAIESIRTIQDDKSIYLSDFSVTYKEIRIASTATTPITSSGNILSGPPVGSPINAVQGAASTNLGQNPGAVAPFNTPGIQSNLTSGQSFSLLANTFKYKVSK